MELLLVNKSFRPIRVIDEFESLIWNERYCSYGDFELCTYVSSDLLNTIKKGYYLVHPEAEQQMIVEDIKIESNAESGNRLVITGRSLESVLDRRIVWTTTNLDGNFQNAVRRLLNENVIKPADPKRTIPFIYFNYSNDAEIRKLTISKQYTGDNLYDAIKELCESNQIGFKITWKWGSNDRITDDSSLDIVDDKGDPLLSTDPVQWMFSLYKGVDRSYDPTEDGIYDHLIDGDGSDILDDEGALIQTVIASDPSGKIYPASKLASTYVVFSPDYDNLISSEYLESSKTLKNVTLVAGEDEGNKRRRRVVGKTSSKGVDRRELYTDARDIQSEKEDGSAMTDKEYNKLLDQRGVEKLSENKETKSFEFQIDPSQTYVYGVDYDKGDIVQVINEYGVKVKSQILEIIRSYEVSGYTIYATVGSYSSNITESHSDSYSGDSGSGSDGSYDSGLPSGGTEGQVLTKNSTTDFDASWQDPKYAFVYEQNGAATSTWTIDHNLGFYPNVTVIDTAGSNVVGEVVHDSKNKMTLLFKAAFKGTAYLS